ncbi:MAG TPA: MmcQ/YjbR family DNA-binding protein [Ohtaekwangia sp.]
MTTDMIREIAMKLPHVTEDVKWGADLCFCIAEKMFCVTGLEGPVTVSLKVTDEEFEELTERTGFTPAPYMARNKWVLIDPSSKISKKELSHYIQQSYTLVKSKLPRKLQAKLS